MLVKRKEQLASQTFPIPMRGCAKYGMMWPNLDAFMGGWGRLSLQLEDYCWIFPVVVPTWNLVVVLLSTQGMPGVM